MSDRSVTHHNFTIECTCNAPPSAVFAAFADPVTKSRWQNSPEVSPVGDPVATDDDGYIEFDFRVGGHERFAFEHGHEYNYDATYFDIVPDQRIAYTYSMHADNVSDSMSIVTIEFLPDGDTTILRYSEQGAFLDGIDDPAVREEGITELLNNLVKYVNGYRPRKQ